MLLAIEGAMRKYIIRDDITKELLAAIKAESLDKALEIADVSSTDHPHIRVTTVEV